MKVFAHAIGVAIGLSQIAAATTAQENRSQWGLAIQLVPRWEFPAAWGAETRYSEVELAGNEVSFGIVRGKLRGGDWGASLLWKGIADGSTATEQAECIEEPRGRESCVRVTHTTQGAGLLGGQVHKTFGLKSFYSRVMIQLTVSAGVVGVQGNVEERSEYLVYNAQTRETNVQSETRTILLKDALTGQEAVPVLGLEPRLAIHLLDMKLFVGGGLHFPGVRLISVGAHYYF